MFRDGIYLGAVKNSLGILSVNRSPVSKGKSLIRLGKPVSGQGHNGQLGDVTKRKDPLVEVSPF